MLGPSRQQPHLSHIYTQHYHHLPSRSLSPSLSSSLPDLDHSSRSDFPLESSPADISHFSHPSPVYYMPASSPNNPPIRVQSSTPSPATAYDVAHSSALGESDRHTASWDQFGDYRHLNPVAGTHRFHLQDRQTSHKRNSSASSIGSVGPASPYTPTVAYPRIIDSDLHSYPSPSYDTFEAVHPTSFVSCQKPSSIVSSPAFVDTFFLPFSQTDVFSPTDNVESQTVHHTTLRREISQRQSVVGVMACSAPTNPCSEDYDTGYKVSMEVKTNVPKLDRTMSDVYQDELYNPSMATSVPVLPARVMVTQHHHFLSPCRDVFSERLQAANNGHISARSSSPVTTISRERSPFRQGSILATEGYSRVMSPTRGLSGNPSLVAQRQEIRKAEAETYQYRRRQQSSEDALTTPRTISPKEAELNYTETEEDAKMPMFQPETIQRVNEQGQTHYSPTHLNAPDTGTGSLDDRDTTFQHSITRRLTPRNQNYPNFSASTSTPSKSALSGLARVHPDNIQVPQQYPFISQSRRQSSNRSTSEQVPEFPANLTSMESSRSDNDGKSSQEYDGQVIGIQRPANTSANSGTYTCTYHGCTQRFETPSKLQKHKRDGHRQPTPPSGSNEDNIETLSANRNSQAGPHKCERLNPVTGKLCNSIFSRPYDLTRHEDTIHNAKKQKVRCQMCTEEKTFSRNDALTRHMRVVHPEVDFPGKTKRRGAN